MCARSSKRKASGSEPGSIPILALVLLFGVLAPRPAEATWSNLRQVVHGTANTLEQGEVMVGIFTPAAYGITDTVMVQLHPINWALLAPNVALRWRVVDEEPVRLAVVFDGGGSIIDDDDAPARQDGRPLGHVYVGAVTTFRVWRSVLFSVHTGYQHDFDPGDDDFVWSAGVSWLIDQANLLMVNGGAQYSGELDALKAPYASVVYAYGWENLRIAVGVAVSDSFPVVLSVAEVERRIAAWPVIDFWGRF